ncbi:unnamed protein product [Amoebophrya sp. A120]|nr:unnamed protein product [Amoebophrya sp. A120]|eukprot:GSA120T00020104001.1
MSLQVVKSRAMLRLCRSRCFAYCRRFVLLPFLLFSPAYRRGVLAQLQAGGSPVCPCIDPVALGKVVPDNGTLSYTSGGTTYTLKQTYGSSCDQWDLGSTHFGDVVYSGCNGNPATDPAWCHDNWCYVDPCECAMDDAEQTGLFATQFPDTAVNLAYSYKTCAQCHRRISSNTCQLPVGPDTHSKCQWDSVNSNCTEKQNSNPALSAAAISCAAKTEDTCGGQMNLNCQYDAASATCSLATQEQRESGWGCPFPKSGDDRCKCLSPKEVGFLPAAAFDANNQIAYTRTSAAGTVRNLSLPGDYGAYCLPWDHMDTLGFDFYGYDDPSTCGGDPTAVQPHCKKQWCYVDPCSCDIGVISQTSMFASLYPTAQGLAYSYAPCAMCNQRGTKAACEASLSCRWDANAEFCMDAVDTTVAAQDCAARSQANCGGVANKNCLWENGQCSLQSLDAIKAAFGCGYFFQVPAVANPPNSRYYSCSTRVGEYIYYFGGSGSDELWRLNLGLNIWERLVSTDDTRTPKGRTGCALVYDPKGSVLYLYAGQDENAMQLDDLWKFSLASTTFGLWIEVNTGVAAKPSPRHRPALALYEGPGTSPEASHNLLVLYGGHSRTVQFADWWTFNTTTEAWAGPVFAGGPLIEPRADMELLQYDATTLFAWGGTAYPNSVADYDSGFMIDMTPGFASFLRRYYVNITADPVVLARATGFAATSGGKPTARYLTGMVKYGDYVYLTMGYSSVSGATFQDTWALQRTDTLSSTATTKGSYQWVSLLDEDASWTSGNHTLRAALAASYSGDGWTGMAVSAFNDRLYLGGAYWSPLGSSNAVRFLEIKNSSSLTNNIGSVWGTDCRAAQADSANATNWAVLPKYCRWQTVHTKVASPAPRRNHGAVALVGYLYVFGGLGNAGAELADMWRMSLMSSGAAPTTWEPVNPSSLGRASNSPPARQHALVVRWEYMMFIHGGCRNLPGASSCGNSGGSDATYLDDAWLYDPIYNKYVSLGSTPIPLARACGAAIGSFVYIFGGVTSTGANDKLFRFYVRGRRWEQLATGTPISDCAMVPLLQAGSNTLLNGKIAILLGETTGQSSPKLAQVFDASSLSATNLAAVVLSRRLEERGNKKRRSSTLREVFESRKRTLSTKREELSEPSESSKSTKKGAAWRVLEGEDYNDLSVPVRDAGNLDEIPFPASETRFLRRRAGPPRAGFVSFGQSMMRQESPGSGPAREADANSAADDEEDNHQHLRADPQLFVYEEINRLDGRALFEHIENDIALHGPRVRQLTTATGGISNRKHLEAGTTNLPTLTTNSWPTFSVDSEIPRGQMAYASVGDSVYFFGGKMWSTLYVSESSQVLQLKLDQETGAAVNASLVSKCPTVDGFCFANPLSRAGKVFQMTQLKAVHHDRRFILFGGEVDGQATNAMFTFDVNTVTESATICSPGTERQVNALTNRVMCTACAAGKYSADGVTCLPCPAGTASAALGLASALGCVSCPAGTYSDTVGATSCKPCDHGAQVCPIGSTSNPSAGLGPMPARPSFTGSGATCAVSPVTVTPPEAYSTAEELLEQIQNFVLATGCVIFFLVLISLYAAYAVKGGDWVRHRFTKFDFLFSTILADKDGDSHPTAVGGIVTIVAVLLLLYLCGAMILALFLDPVREEKKVVPTFVAQSMLEEAGDKMDKNIEDKFTMYLIATALGYNKACVYSNVNNSYACHPSAAASNPFCGGGGSTSLFCEKEVEVSNTTTNCKMTWVCKDCQFGVGDDRIVDLSFGEPDAQATGLVAEVSTTSSIPPKDVQGSDEYTPDTLSKILTTFTPSSRRIFKGIDPSTLNLKAVPAIYTFGDSGPEWDVIRTGLQLEYSSLSKGSEATESETPFVEGLHLRVTFAKASTTLVTNRFTQYDLEVVIGAMGGFAEMVIGGLGISVLALAHMQKKRRERRKVDKTKVCVVEVWAQATHSIQPFDAGIAMYYCQLQLGTEKQFRYNDLDTDLVQSNGEHMIMEKIDEYFRVEVKKSDVDVIGYTLDGIDLQGRLEFRDTMHNSLVAQCMFDLPGDKSGGAKRKLLENAGALSDSQLDDAKMTRRYHLALRPPVRTQATAKTERPALTEVMLRCQRYVEKRELDAEKEIVYGPRRAKMLRQATELPMDETKLVRNWVEVNTALVRITTQIEALTRKCDATIDDAALAQIKGSLDSLQQAQDLDQRAANVLNRNSMLLARQKEAQDAAESTSPKSTGGRGFFGFGSSSSFLSSATRKSSPTKQVDNLDEEKALKIIRAEVETRLQKAITGVQDQIDELRSSYVDRSTLDRVMTRLDGIEQELFRSQNTKPSSPRRASSGVTAAGAVRHHRSGGRTSSRSARTNGAQQGTGATSQQEETSGGSVFGSLFGSFSGGGTTKGGGSDESAAAASTTTQRFQPPARG